MNKIEKIIGEKEVKAFKKDIKRWLKPFKKRIKIEIAKTYECVITKPKIYIDIVRDLKIDNSMDNAHKKVYEESEYNFMKELDYYTFAFLHELGHIMTTKPKDFKEDGEAYEEEMYEHLEDKKNYSFKELIKIHMNTTFEKRANNWAYTFWLDNKNYCHELENILKRHSL